MAHRDHNFSEFQKVLTMLTTNTFVSVMCAFAPERGTVFPRDFIKIRQQA